MQIGGCTALVQSGKYSGHNLAIVFGNRGLGYYNKGQYDQAIQDFDQSLKIDPNYEKSYMNRGNSYLNKQQYDRALRDYDQYVRLKPNDPDGYSNRAITYARKEQYDLALQEYGHVIRLKPNSFEAYGDRGNLYYDKHEYERAIADYTKAIAINPQNSAMYVDRGDAYTRLKDYDRAIGDYTAAIEKNSRNAEAFKSRAVAYRTKNDYERAIADHTKAIELQGSDGELWASRGDTYLAKRDYQQAAVDYTKSFSLVREDRKGVVLRARWIANLEAKQNGAAIADLLTLSTNYQKSIEASDSSRVYRTLTGAGKDNRADDAVKVIQALKRADYRGQDPRQLYDGLDSAMIDALARLGRIDEVAAVIPNLKRYTSFLKLRIDGRYAGLQARPAVAALLQPQDFAARELAAAQKAAATFPKNFDTQANLVRSLILNGRYAEAVNLGRSVLSNLSAYESNVQQEASIRNAVADALAAHGQFDAAVQVLQPVVALDVNQHGFAVNQLINLGSMMMWEGRLQDGIDMARKARGHSSTYGEMWIKSTEICGFAWMGRTAEAESILQELLKTADSNYGATTESLICLGRSDQAAAMVIERLKSEADRSSMLLDLQDCRDGPSQPKLRRQHRTALLKVRDRGDVRKTLDSVGFVISEPVACGDR